MSAEALACSGQLAVRLAGIEDVEAVAVLFDRYRQFYEQAPDLALATRFVQARLQRRESEILLAHHADGDLLGFCQLYPTFCSVLAQPIYALYDLYVVEHARQQGAGRLLLQAAHALALRHGKARMDLTTAKSNLPAQSLYASLGWVKDEVFLLYNRSVECTVD